MRYSRHLQRSTNTKQQTLYLRVCATLLMRILANGIIFQISVTRWLQDLFNIWPFRLVKYAQEHRQIFGKVFSPFCLTLNKYTLKQIAKDFEFSPNLVTLLQRQLQQASKSNDTFWCHGVSNKFQSIGLRSVPIEDLPFSQKSIEGNSMHLIRPKLHLLNEVFKPQNEVTGIVKL